MTLTRTFFVIATLYFSVNIMAQKKYSPGIIILNNSDTISGFLANKQYKVNSEKCEFKTTKNSEYKTYYPFDIQGYWFSNGKYYVSKKVVIDSTEMDLFLEYIVNGKLKIYCVTKNGGNMYFIEKEGEKITFLDDRTTYYLYDGINKKWVITETEKTQKVSQSTKYKGLLKYILAETPDLQKNAENISLNHKTLINLSKDYHNTVCDNEECIIYEKNIKQHVTIGTGISYGFFSYPNPYKHIVAREFNSSRFYFPGLKLGVQLKSISENLFLNAELLFNNINEVIIEEDFGSKLTGLGRTISLTTSYNFPSKKIYPYANAGVAFHKISNYNYETMLIENDIITSTKVDNELYSIYSYSNIGSILGAGVKIPVKNLHFELGVDYFHYFTAEKMNALRFNFGFVYVLMTEKNVKTN